MSRIITFLLGLLPATGLLLVLQAYVQPLVGWDGATERVALAGGILAAVVGFIQAAMRDWKTAGKPDEVGASPTSPSRRRDRYWLTAGFLAATILVSVLTAVRIQPLPDLTEARPEPVLRPDAE